MGKTACDWTPCIPDALGLLVCPWLVEQKREANMKLQTRTDKVFVFFMARIIAVAGPDFGGLHASFLRCGVRLTSTRLAIQSRPSSRAIAIVFVCASIAGRRAGLAPGSDGSAACLRRTFSSAPRWLHRLPSTS